MRYVSTRGECPPADLETALLTGLAPDGGLYMPESLPVEAPAGDRSVGLAARAAAVLAPFVAELPPAELAELTADAFDFPVPLVELGEGIFLLELFHGPTLAFKDVGARFMARLVARLRGGSGPLTVLVATSGDTGSAVAHAFAGQPGLRVAILYPRGRVSALQEKQITTAGDGVLALAVDGDFDDCQRLVKAAFADRRLSRELGLTSANSINVGRLLPQMVYYFHAAARLPRGLGPPLFSTPSGNFGNLTAGLMARATGLATAGFLAATNVNDSVPRYLAGGLFEPRPARPTLSSAMDVGRPSNFDRMRWLFDDDVAAMRRVVSGSRHDDEATAAVLRRVYETSGRVIDPHTAVAVAALLAARSQDGASAPGIALATAHPAKFGAEIESILGVRPPLPERLAACLDRDSRSQPLAADSRALAAALERWRRKADRSDAG